MKRPQVNGNKLVSRYTDTTSLALRNYIDISSQRLNKVRAGKQLTTVLKRSTPSLLIRSQQTPDLYNAEKDPASLNGFSSHRSEKATPAPGKQLALSEFMGTYLTQKNIDEELLAKKEGRIYEFFKEKFLLMGKYLGEDVLKTGLAVKSPNNEVVENKPKKHKNLDHENRDPYHPTHFKDEKAALDDKEGPAAKILSINKEVMGLILKEEHEMEMKALMNLQTEQNMQVFNDLQDVGLRDSHKKSNSAALTRTPPPKMILKNNFLRTFVDIGAGTDFPSTTPEKYSSTGYRSSKKRYTSSGTRPKTEYLVFRTQQKKDVMAPDVERISNQFDSHKYGKKVAPVAHHMKNVPSSSGLESMNTEDELRYTDKLKVPRQISLSKLETPQASIESTRHRNRFDTGTFSTSKSVKALIGEEIEFLNNNRESAMSRAHTAAGVRIPTRFQEQNYQTENKVTVETEQREVLSHRDMQTREGKRQVILEPKKGLVVSKSHAKLSTGLFEDANGQVQGVRIVNKHITNISPKLETVPIKVAVQGPALKTHGALKRDAKNPGSHSIQLKSPQGLDTLIAVNSGEKRNSFATKLVPVRKDEVYLPTNDEITGFSSVKTTSKGFIFDQRSGSSSGLLTRTNFGNKYWKNTFND